MGKRLKLKARVGEHVFTCNGREAETLLKLIAAGPVGITPLDAHRAGPCYRLAAYCFDLRQLGVPIEATLEAHEGGRHSRYRLAASVVIIDRNDFARKVA